MAQVDIELPERLQEFLAQPRCLDLSLPEPASLSLTLPNGGKIKAIGDVTKGIPSDCSLSFSLLLQLGPLLASIECIVKILKLLEPLTEVIKGLPFPPVEAIKKFAEAVPPVIECAVAFTPAGGLLLFVRDILCLIIKILNCLIDQFKSIAALLGGLTLQIQSAQDQGNQELLENLECAQQNANKSAQAVFQSIEPVTVILELAAPLIELTPVGGIEIPSFAPAEDVEQINQTISALEGFVDTLQLAADALGGCD